MTYTCNISQAVREEAGGGSSAACSKPALLPGARGMYANIGDLRQPPADTCRCVLGGVVGFLASDRATIEYLRIHRQPCKVPAEQDT